MHRQQSRPHRRNRCRPPNDVRIRAVNSCKRAVARSATELFDVPCCTRRCLGFQVSLNHQSRSLGTSPCHGPQTNREYDNGHHHFDQGKPETGIRSVVHSSDSRRRINGSATVPAPPTNRLMSMRCDGAQKNRYPTAATGHQPGEDSSRSSGRAPRLTFFGRWWERGATVVKRARPRRRVVTDPRRVPISRQHNCGTGHAGRRDVIRDRCARIEVVLEEVAFLHGGEIT